LNDLFVLKTDPPLLKRRKPFKLEIQAKLNDFQNTEETLYNYLMW